MFVVDTDIMTLLQHGHEQVTDRFRQSDRIVVTTVITRIEILQGRMASVIKAENGERLQLAHERPDWFTRKPADATGLLLSNERAYNKHFGWAWERERNENRHSDCRPWQRTATLDQPDHRAGSRPLLSTA